MKPIDEVLYDGEVSLRMVARALRELDGTDGQREVWCATLRGELHDAVDLLPIQELEAPQVNQLALVFLDLHERLTRVSRDAGGLRPALRIKD